MSKLTDHVIDYFWDKLIKPLLDWVLAHADRYDLAFLAILALFAYIVYFYWQYFVAGEKGLYVGAFIIAVVIWFLIRNLQRQRSAHRMHATGIVIIICGLCAGWAYGAYTVYRVPFAPTDRASVYLAWFKNDPGQDSRKLFNEELRKAIKVNDLEICEIPLLDLPRRIDDQICLFDLPRRIDDQEAASEIGKKVGAIAVFWGYVNRSKVHPRFTLVGFEEMHKTVHGNEDFIGAIHVEPNMTEIPPKIANIQQGLLDFIVGYWVYRNASHDKALYDEAIQYFKFAFDYFQTHQSEFTGDKYRTKSVNSMLGIISFYLGNTYLAKEDYDEAEIYYRVALDKTKHRKGHPQYIEALNNLSLLLTRRNPREAIELLNQANSLCTKGKPVAPVACTHVLYNLALAQLEVQDYEAALNTLESVLKAAGNLGENEADYRLIANSHRLLAYTMIKEADDHRGDPREIDVSYARAEDHIHRAIETFNSHDLDYDYAPFNVLKARLEIRRKNWSAARDLLVKANDWYANHPDLSPPDLPLLMTVVYGCLGESEAAGALQLYLDTVREEYSSKGLNFFKKHIADCKVNIGTRVEDAEDL